MDSGLEDLLRDLGDNIDWPSIDVASAVMHNISTDAVPRSRRVGRRWQPVVLVVALVLAALFLLPGPRQAVADFLGIPGIRLELVDGPPPPGSVDLNLGPTVPLDVAADSVSFAVRTLTGLQSQPAVFIAGTEMDRRVVTVWAPDPDLPETFGGSGVGLVFEQFVGSFEDFLVTKTVSPDTTVERVSVEGVLGFWIEGGPHEIAYENGSGSVVVDSTRLAANVLMWEVGGVANRFESRLDLAGTLDLVARLEAAG